MEFDRTDLAALALTSRLVPSDVKPLTASEFWPLTRTANLAGLVGMTVESIHDHYALGAELSNRVARLLARGTALALSIEQLEQQGIWTASALGDFYPGRLRDRLADNAPPYLHGVGDAALLTDDGVGVVGSRDVDADGAQVARDIAQISVAANHPLISGGARGVDRHSMNSAFEHGGAVVGVLADSLVQAVTKPSTRQAISSGQVCLITPYIPTAPFSAGNAMGRNKLIYGLSRYVVVVRSDDGSGGTWAGAAEAIKKRISNVVSWTGSGSAAGNTALVGLGATELTAISEFSAMLEVTPPQPLAPRSMPFDQPSLF